MVTRHEDERDELLVRVRVRVCALSIVCIPEARRRSINRLSMENYRPPSVLYDNIVGTYRDSKALGTLGDSFRRLAGHRGSHRGWLHIDGWDK